MTQVIAILRDPDTGDAAVHRTEYLYEAEAAEHYWTEGNFACDCNRSDIIRRANGLPVLRPTICGRRIILEALFYDGERIA